MSEADLTQFLFDQAVHNGRMTAACEWGAKSIRLLAQRLRKKKCGAIDREIIADLLEKEAAHLERALVKKDLLKE